MTGSKTLLITGVSTGLGRAFAREALAAGHRVVGTVRQTDHVAAFEDLAPGRAFGLVLDVTDEAAVGPVVGEAERAAGPIDVLIANAGYGHEGTFEESSMDDLRRQFEVNVFGAVAVIKAVLPGMRERRSGHVMAVTSMGGLIAFPGLSFYHGSKFALEGILTSLAKEVAPFGVRVTAIEPGAFRTDWAGRSMARAPRSVSDYDTLFDPIRANRQGNSGRQPGDPARAGTALLRVIDADEPPVHLLLGTDALRLVAAGRSEVDADIAGWQELSASTDFPPETAAG
jgi:NAD(P)-dependent dehydrogenase (short-subunit alcohol dehydrogenase family)